MRKVNLMILVLALMPIQSFATDLDKADCLALKLMISNQSSGANSVKTSSKTYPDRFSYGTLPSNPNLSKEENQRIADEAAELERIENEKIEKEEAERERIELAEKTRAMTVIEKRIDAITAVYNKGNCDSQFADLNRLVEKELKK